MACMKNPGTAALVILVAIILLIGIAILFQNPSSPEEHAPPLTDEQESANATPTPLRTVTTRATIMMKETATPTRTTL